MRQPVQEVRRPVQRIDDPAMLGIAAGDGAALLHQEAVVGPAVLQLLAQDLLGLVVGGGDEIARPLDGDLKLLDLAEIAAQPSRRLVGGPGHHIDECGAGRHGFRGLSPSRVRRSCCRWC